ncbi:MAG: hypothetical protein RI923_1362, partial [Pseudomonadota bacterium]
MRPLRLLLVLLILAPSGLRAEDSGWLDSGKKWVQQLWRDDSEAWLGRINA